MVELADFIGYLFQPLERMHDPFFTYFDLVRRHLSLPPIEIELTESNKLLWLWSPFPFTFHGRDGDGHHTPLHKRF